MKVALVHCTMFLNQLRHCTVLELKLCSVNYIVHCVTKYTGDFSWRKYVWTMYCDLNYERISQPEHLNTPKEKCQFILDISLFKSTKENDNVFS